MAWTTPLTAVANAALTSSQWNASVRDNLNQTAPALASASGQIFVSTGANAIAARTPTASLVTAVDTTTSLTSTVLANAGPAVTVTTGANAIVTFGAWGRNNTSADGGQMYCVVSGATTVSEAEESSVVWDAEGASNVYRTGWITCLFSGLTPGSNTFTCKYKALGGGTATFAYRRLLVVPL